MGFSRVTWTAWTIWAIITFVASQSSPPLMIPNTLGTHDPSRIIEDNGAYYFYGTSRDITGYYTRDNGTTWKSTGPVLVNGVPANVLAVVPQNDGHEIWAPDVIYNPYNKLFHIYYYVPSSNSGTHLHSATALVTSPTLDPDKAVWTNRGPVIASTYKQTNYSSLDPYPFFDTEGNFWLDFGSAYAGSNGGWALDVIQLDKTTGLRKDGAWIIGNQACTGCEASALEPHGGYYYLFWNNGGCCSGAASTYTIHVARSTSVTGPYGANRIFLASENHQHGPGQIGFITLGGKEYFTYHYYPDTGNSVLGIRPLTWADDWPVPG